MPEFFRNALVMHECMELQNHFAVPQAHDFIVEDREPDEVENEKIGQNGADTGDGRRKKRIHLRCHLRKNRDGKRRGETETEKQSRDEDRHVPVAPYAVEPIECPHMKEHVREYETKQEKADTWVFVHFLYFSTFFINCL